MDEQGKMSMFMNAYNGKRVLVTGHTGFKGSWLITWLKMLGADVAGYSIDVPSNPSHFELLDLGDTIRDFRGDIRDRRALAAAMDEFRPQIIFHLAAQAIVRKSYDSPYETFDVNVMGMVNLLDLIRTREHIEAAVLITSDKAYRNVEWPWGYRETDILGGNDPYSSSKGCAELVAYSFFQSFIKQSNIRIATTRAGNVIGGGDWAADRIIPDCVRAWSTGEQVMIRSPKATRPWQHVLEPLSGYLWLGAHLLKNTPDLNGEAFNFGPNSDVTESVEQLLEVMAQNWPEVKWSSPEIIQANLHEAHLLKLSCDKALLQLKWKPVLNFRETVGMTAEWYLGWMRDKKSVPVTTKAQISSYSNLAQTRMLNWAI